MYDISHFASTCVSKFGNRDVRKSFFKKGTEYGTVRKKLAYTETVTEFRTSLFDGKCGNPDLESFSHKHTVLSHIPAPKVCEFAYYPAMLI